METLETIVIWALLIVSAAVVGLAVRAVLKKIAVSFEQSTAAPALIGSIAAFGVLAVLLTGGGVPFLFAVIVALAAGLAAGALVKRVLARHRNIELGLAIVVAIAVVVLAVLIGSPSKLVDFAVVALIGIFTVVLLGSRSLPDRVSDALPTVGAVVTFIGLFDWLQAKVDGSDLSRMERILQSPEMERIAATVWTVILAVGGSTALFVGANLLFDRTDKKWRQFSAAAGAVIGLIIFGVLDGNRLIQHLGPRDSIASNLHDLVNDSFWSLLVSSIIIGAAIGYPAGYAIGVSRDDRKTLPLTGVVVGAGLGLVWGTLFAQRIPVDTTVFVIWNALTGALLCGLLGYAISRFEDDRQRAIVATVGGGLIGLLVGGMLFSSVQPRLETAPLILSTFAFAVIGTGINALRGKGLFTGMVTGALVGWLMGCFGFPTLGGGPDIETMFATGVAGALGGLRYGAKPYLDSVERVNLEQRSRAAIFLGPAMVFIGAGLVIPLIRTIYLSLFDEGTDNWVGLENYQRIFTDDRSFALSAWRDLFTSQLFRVGALLIIVALIIGMRVGRTAGNSLRGSRFIVPVLGAVFLFAAYREFQLATSPAEIVDGVVVAEGGSWTFSVIIYLLLLLGGAGLLIMSGLPALVSAGSGGTVSTGATGAASSSGAGTGSSGSASRSRFSLSAATTNLGGGHAAALVIGIFLVAFATFASLRGTIFNNLWWVFTVTFLSAGLGLAVAVLADRANHESVAKSFIFMPLAISFVGAGIIWRFMYIARDPSKDQTGVMNFLWVELGRISTGGIGRVIGIIFLIVMLVGLGTLAWSAARAGLRGVTATSIVLILPFAWALWRFTFGGGMGGTGVLAGNDVVQGTTVLFLQDSQPFNNLWLMLVLIWIQTGFAMVIFSAAIKAVPSELIEAAKIDGANDSQVFWRITVPSIAPTIGVVVTTLIVVVMKVFDIVKVMTNGNFDTQVVANEMWQRAFTELNFGLGSALAIVLFVAVVPVMFYNIRTMRRDL